MIKFLISQVLKFTIISCMCFISRIEASALENNSPQKYQLAVCALFQNETFFLHEWLEYHRSIGVDHFYLYNNLSSDNYLEVLDPYIKKGLVDLYDLPIEVTNQKEYLELLQLPAYNNALELSKHEAAWIAFIDLDEFIVPFRHDNLQDMLQEYKDYAGLAINWQVFGTSNVVDLPKDKLITESLQLKTAYQYGLNQTVKLIVQPNCVELIKNPHSFQYYPNYYAVSSLGVPLKNNQMGQSVHLDTVCINHYWFGSLNWFKSNKIPRREKWGLKIPHDHLDALIDMHNVVKDESIQRFVPKLKESMKTTFDTSEQPFVTCDLMGQLGNQFFQIATATSLALDNGMTAQFPGLTTEKDFNVPLNYSKVFNHLDVTKSKFPVENRYMEKQFTYSPIPFHPNMSIRGWFQSDKYFRHHREEIIELFSPRREISEYLKGKYKELIEQENTVSIHYRSYKAEDPSNAVYAECGMDYFQRAISVYPEDSIFVVFSNDIQWCKNNFTKLPHNFVFIENETHYHDLYLMSMCKHHIICNSSFSWWGAYLNKNPNKVVIAPAKWFNPNYETKTQDLIPEEWLQL